MLKGLESQPLPNEIMPGQLWGLSWNFSSEELVVIKNPGEQFSTVCPVSNFHTYPAIKIGSDKSYNWPYHENYVWPNISFKVSNKYLDSFYGQFFDSLRFKAISNVENDERLIEVNSLLKYNISEETESREIYEYIFAKYKKYRFINSPRYQIKDIPTKYKNPEKIMNLLNLSSLREGLEILEGRQPITDDQIETISTELGFELSEYTEPFIPEGEKILSSPAFKYSILELAETNSTSEEETRKNLSKTFNLPSRSQADSYSRMVSIIEEMLGV